MSENFPAPAEHHYTDEPSFALFSGGHDSLVNTHYCMSYGLTDEVIYLDTNTGLPENLEFVRDVCDKYGWPLRVEESPMTLEEYTERYGFPVPGTHSWAYRYFKERQLGYIATEHDERPHYFTGVRRHESEVRMRTVSAAVQEADRWTWHSPIRDWREELVRDYMETHDLPKNPIKQRLHRSGDCFCGAFANRNEELIELEAHYPDHAEWLLNLEDEVQEERDENDRHGFWGTGGLSDSEIRGLVHESDDEQFTLCGSCQFPRAEGAEGGD